MRLRLPRRNRDLHGIEIRISTPDGVVVDADSEHLYYAAKYGGGAWLDLIAGNGDGTGLSAPAEEFSTVPLKIQIRAAMLKPVGRR